LQILFAMRLRQTFEFQLLVSLAKSDEIGVEIEGGNYRARFGVPVFFGPVVNGGANETVDILRRRKEVAGVFFAQPFSKFFNAIRFTTTERLHRVKRSTDVCLFLPPFYIPVR
jgi:hypothetical protein